MIEFKLPKDKKTTECKGLFWRGSANTYLSQHKSIELRKSLRFLKRKSCKGCEKCDWTWENISEDIANDLSILDIKDGALYQYKLEISQDYESGQYEIDGSYFIEAKEND
jgi:hypothetical protein